MNPTKCTEHDYINFLIAAQKTYSASEAASPHPQADDGHSHDTYTRLPPDSQALWHEIEPYIDKAFGLLVIDDSTLDKSYAKHMGLVMRHWSGKHHNMVQGINLITLVWTDGQCAFQCDYRIYIKEDGLTKNDHFSVMLEVVKARDFALVVVAFDSWYSNLENLKHVRDMGWVWLTRLKSNRQVSLQPGHLQTVADVDVPQTGLQVHLKGYGFVRIFRTVDPHGDMSEDHRRALRYGLI